MTRLEDRVLFFSPENINNFYIEKTVSSLLDLSKDIILRENLLKTYKNNKNYFLIINTENAVEFIPDSILNFFIFGTKDPKLIKLDLKEKKSKLVFFNSRVSQMPSGSSGKIGLNIGYTDEENASSRIVLDLSFYGRFWYFIDLNM